MLDSDAPKGDVAPLSLSQLGYSSFFQTQLESLGEPLLLPARVVRGHRGVTEVIAARGRLSAAPSGRLLHEAKGPSDLPTVGDWVGLRPDADIQSPAVIAHVLARRTALTRRAAGKRVEAQVLAANVDAVMIVSSFNADFNPRRLERYIELALEGGARPLVILNKADLLPQGREAFAEEVRAVAPSIPILAVSALEGEGMSALLSHAPPGETIAIVGSSGVGKSTIVNALLGSGAQETGEIRAHDDRGKHTTTGRELFVLPNGALLVDTPGLRELQAWAAIGDPVGFSDIESLALRCRFRDCAHAGEPGCEVARAVASGDLDEARLRAFQKRSSERLHLVAQQDALARIRQKRLFRERAKITKRSPKT